MLLEEIAAPTGTDELDFIEVIEVACDGLNVPPAEAPADGNDAEADATLDEADAAMLEDVVADDGERAKVDCDTNASDDPDCEIAAA